MKDMRDSLIQSQNMKGEFPNPNRETRVPYPNHDREEGYPNPHEYMMKVDVHSFSENLNIESFLDWIYKVDKLFDMIFIQIVAYKLKRGAYTWWDQIQVSRKRQVKQHVMR